MVTFDILHGWLEKTLINILCQLLLYFLGFCFLGQSNQSSSSKHMIHYLQWALIYLKLLFKKFEEEIFVYFNFKLTQMQNELDSMNGR